MNKHVFPKSVSILLICLSPLFCFSQSHLQKGNKLFTSLAYSDAISEYEKAVKQNPSDAEAVVQLAHCYRLVNNSMEAEKWYAKAVTFNEAKPECMLYYTQALMSNGNYKEAEKWIQKYKESKGSNEEADKIILSLKNLNSLYLDSANYAIEKLSINSNHSDFGPVVYDNGLVFASARNRIEMVQRTHQWTGRPFYSIYYAKGADRIFKEPKIFTHSIMTKYNDGPVCFNKTGDELFVTRNNIENGKVKESENGIVKLKIFEYKKSGNKWVGGVPFPYNSDQYNCAYPCLSPDANKIYFSSDMPGGYGLLDLYVCERKGDSWGQPVNLGPTINTSGSDGFPFLDNEGGIYFASNGRGGLGGYDIFFSPKSGSGTVEVINLGFPVNSSYDDFGWFQNESATSGYFASNREDKNDNDDIYSFRKISVLLNVLVYDSKTNSPLPNAKVNVVEAGILKRTVSTSDKGTFNMFLNPGKEYKFIASNEKYTTDSAEILMNTVSTEAVKSLTIALNRSPVKINVNGKVFLNSDSSGVPLADVVLVNLTTGEEQKATSIENGAYHFDQVAVNCRFKLVAKKNNCVSSEREISTIDLTDDKNFTEDLAMNCVNDVVKLENIYYDFDKYYIRKDALPVLDKMVVFLKSNPGMNIELRSHTDCRGTQNYNMVLSQKRARSAVDYLIRNGIPSKHLTAKGYGETMLLNQCACEGKIKSSCSDEENQVNRRTEFKILNFDTATGKDKGLQVVK